MASGAPGGCMRRPARGSAAALRSHPTSGRRGQVWHGVAGRAGLLGAGEECRGAVGDREGEAPAPPRHGGGGRASPGPRRPPRPSSPAPAPAPTSDGAGRCHPGPPRRGGAAPRAARGWPGPSAAVRAPGPGQHCRKPRWDGRREARRARGDRAGTAGAAAVGAVKGLRRTGREGTRARGCRAGGQRDPGTALRCSAALGASPIFSCPTATAEIPP